LFTLSTKAIQNLTNKVVGDMKKFWLLCKGKIASLRGLVDHLAPPSRIDKSLTNLKTKSLHLLSQSVTYIRNHQTSATLTYVLVVFSLFLTIGLVRNETSYNLTKSTAHLIGSTTKTKLSSKLTYNKEAKAWQLNQTALKEANASIKNTASDSKTPDGKNIPEAVKAQLAAQQAAQNNKDSASSKKDQDPYGLELPQDSSKGMKVVDTNTKLAFSLIPQFSTSAGRVVAIAPAKQIPDKSATM
jgi:hypothetical protein